MAEYDLIGIGGPIWFYREPANLRLFIYNMSDMTDKLCFPFCTHGASPAGFMFSMVPALKRKGLTIIGYNDWYGGCHQLPYILTVHPCNGHPDEVDLKEAEEFGREIAERAQRIAAGETNLIPELPKPEDDLLWRPRDESVIGPPPDIENRKMALKEMKINMEKCTYPECTLCLEVCPMDSLDFSVSPPVRKENCLGCFSCEGVCPQGAIEVDLERFFGVTEQRPSIDQEDHADHADHADRKEHPFFKHILEAAATGRFRWLIPVEEAQSNTPMSKLRQHPRYTLD